METRASRLEQELKTLQEGFKEKEIENLLKNFSLLQLIANGQLKWENGNIVMVNKEVPVSKVTVINRNAGIVKIGDKKITKKKGKLFIILWENFAEAVEYSKIFAVLYPREKVNKKTFDKLHHVKSILAKEIDDAGFQIDSAKGNSGCHMYWLHNRAK